MKFALHARANKKINRIEGLVSKLNGNVLYYSIIYLIFKRHSFLVIIKTITQTTIFYYGI